MKPLHKLLIALLIIFIVTGCSNENNYIQYTPETGSLFRIVFEYPQEWEWKHINITADFDALMTPPPDIRMGTFNQEPYGVISIRVSTKKIKAELLSKMNEYIRINYAIASRVNASILNQEIMIDGNSARQIIYSQPARKEFGEIEPTLRRVIIIIESERLYIIQLDILESKRNSKFGNDFDNLIQSIKFTD